MKKSNYKHRTSHDFKVLHKDNCISYIERFEDILDEITLSDSDKKHFNKAIETLKEDIGLETEYIDIPADEMAKDGEFVDSFMYHLEYDKLGVAELERMQELLQQNGYLVIKCESLAAQIKAEAFEQELRENPYQLKLIA